MRPDNKTANPGPLPEAITGMDSLCHFLNNPSASSNETVIFLLMARTLGKEAAQAIADGFNWKIDSIALGASPGPVA
jgi:hypothetical protein